MTCQYTKNKKKDELELIAQIGMERETLSRLELERRYIQDG